MKYSPWQLGQRLVQAVAIAGLTLFAPPLSVTALAFDYTIQPGQTAGNPAGQPLYAVTVDADDIGDRFTVNWALAAQGDRPELAATATFTVIAFTPNRLILDVQITNQTPAPSAAALMSLGLGIAGVNGADLVGSNGQPHAFDNLIINDDIGFPGDFPEITVCLFTANNCHRGATDNGLQAPAADALRLVLTGDFNPEIGVTLASFPLRMATAADSFALAGYFPGVTPTFAISRPTELPPSVMDAIYQAIATETRSSTADLQVLESTVIIWPQGCSGSPAEDCIPALVSGYRVVVASASQIWVYRADTQGTMVILEQRRSRF